MAFFQRRNVVDGIDLLKVKAETAYVVRSRPVSVQTTEFILCAFVRDNESFAVFCTDPSENVYAALSYLLPRIVSVNRVVNTSAHLPIGFPCLFGEFPYSVGNCDNLVGHFPHHLRY